jgi:hypothetical protein
MVELAGFWNVHGGVLTLLLALSLFVLGQIVVPEGGADDAGGTGEGGDQGGTGEGGDLGAAAAAAAGAAGAAGAPAAGTVPDGYLPQHRYDELNTRFEDSMRLAQEQATQIQSLQRMLGTVAGITPPAAPADPRETAVRERMYKLFPILRKVEQYGEQLERLASFADDIPQVQGVSRGFWASLARQNTAELTKLVAEKIVGDPSYQLTPQETKFYQGALRTWLEEDVKRVRRYEGQDQTLITEFVAELEAATAGLRRRSDATRQRRAEAGARLPSGAAGAGVAGGAAAPKPLTPENVHQKAWEALQAATAEG